ncbi:MAG: GAF domain-containing protein [Anaerolineales bacterium]|nr:GAF domain-containing protein [Anaerolineales bacterium]
MDDLRQDWSVWLRAQRRRAIDLLLGLILLLGLLGLSVSIWSLFYHGYTSNLLIYSLAYLYILALFLLRRVQDEWRVLGFVLILFAFAAYSFYSGWLVSSGRVYLLALIVVSTLMVRPMAGLLAALSSMLTFVLFAVAYGLGWLSLRPLPDPVTVPPMILEGVGFSMCIVIVASSLWFFEQSMKAATQANAQAQAARALLAERAEQLEAANQLLDRRAEALQAAIQVARDATSILDLPSLLDQVAALVARRFAYPFTAFYLAADPDQKLALRSTFPAKASSQPAAIGELVAAAAASGQPQLRAGSYLETQSTNPTATDTIAQLALPMRARERVIGVLEVHAAGAQVFGDEESKVLSLLADQIALAISNAQLFESAQDREVLEELVRQRTAQLEAANIELESFSYSVSHDLRAPLRAIDGFSAAIIEDYAQVLPAEAQGYLQRVRRSAQNMASLIDGLLRLSRLTRAAMIIETVDLSALVLEITRGLQSANPERQAEFRIQPGLEAQGDASLLQLLMQNLLENAWKFTSQRPQALIEFGVEQVEGQRAFYVRDNGVGFDMAYAEKLFGPFQRLHRADEFPGSGIGLATVRRIVQRHGGRIWAVGAVDQGATFYFSL